MLFALAYPFRWAIARTPVKHFSKMQAVIPANYFDRLDPGVFDRPKKLLISGVIGRQPA